MLRMGTDKSKARESQRVIAGQPAKIERKVETQLLGLKRRKMGPHLGDQTETQWGLSLQMSFRARPGAPVRKEARKQGGRVGKKKGSVKGRVS